MPDVKMYTTTWCGVCVHTKRYLKIKNVPFEEIDIEEHPEIGDRIEQATGGYRIVPTLEIDGKLMVNPSRREIDEALAAEPQPVAAAPAGQPASPEIAVEQPKRNGRAANKPKPRSRAAKR